MVWVFSTDYIKKELFLMRNRIHFIKPRVLKSQTEQRKKQRHGEVFTIMGLQQTK